MGHATVRSFADLGAIFNDVFNHAASASKKEMAAATERGENATNAAAPVFLCADDVRQGVTGHNVRYVLGFGLLAAVVGLAVAALVVGHGSGAMPPA